MCPSCSCDSSDVDIPFHIGRQDGEAVPRLITVVWREASPAGPLPIRTTTPKVVELFPFPTPIRPLQGRFFFFRISAGVAFCATQRLAFVGQLRRPSAYVPSRSCDLSGTDKSLKTCVILYVYPRPFGFGRTRRSAPTMCCHAVESATQ